MPFHPPELQNQLIRQSKNKPPADGAAEATEEPGSPMSPEPGVRSLRNRKRTRSESETVPAEVAEQPPSSPKPPAEPAQIFVDTTDLSADENGEGKCS